MYFLCFWILPDIVVDVIVIMIFKNGRVVNSFFWGFLVAKAFIKFVFAMVYFKYL